MSRKYKVMEQSAEKIVFERQARGTDYIPPCIFLFLAMFSFFMPPPEYMGISVFCVCGCMVFFVIMYWACLERERITMDKGENAIVIERRHPPVSRWKAASRIPFASLASHPYLDRSNDDGGESFWVIVKRDDGCEVTLINTPSRYEAESWRACIECFIYPV